jgi:putative PIN family toxin of toxin-antitoxin system
MSLKILPDTNILISALLYPSSIPSLALFHAAKHHELVLSDYNITEFRRVASTKFSRTLSDIDVFLAELTYILIFAPHFPQKLISDPKDAPILNAAILEGVDIIISGDKHFLSLVIEHPKIMTAAEYINLTQTEE